MTKQAKKSISHQNMSRKKNNSLNFSHDQLKKNKIKKVTKKAYDGWESKHIKTMWHYREGKIIKHS